jgi:ABC-2 type transport system ATP-binding protein
MSPETTNWAIRTTGLQKSYGSHQVLGGVDLAVPAGTVFALLGPNGAGKTTIVRILATLVRPEAGLASVAGLDVIRERHRVRRNISLTGQDVAIDELQTGAENLRMMARLSGLSATQARIRAGELLARFDLRDAAGKRVGTYSGGMRRRLDLAAGLVGRPSVIFLDEPTTGLDLPSRQAMWQVITELVGSGVTVFITTQYLDEADRLADRIAVMNGGIVVAEGTPAELKSEVADQRLDLTMTNASSFDDVSTALSGRILAADATRLTLSVATDGTAANIRAVLDGVDPNRLAVRHFAVHTATMDDVFLALTARPIAESEREQANV